MLAEVPRAILLMGPTGAGKTDLAVELAAEWPVEIISVDSALVYRGMDIGTAKPSTAEQARVPHHLIDILEVREQADVTLESGGCVAAWCYFYHAPLPAYAEPIPSGDFLAYLAVASWK